MIRTIIAALVAFSAIVAIACSPPPPPPSMPEARLDLVAISKGVAAAEARCANPTPDLVRRACDTLPARDAAWAARKRPTLPRIACAGASARLALEPLLAALLEVGEVPPYDVISGLAAAKGVEPFASCDPRHPTTTVTTSEEGVPPVSADYPR